MKTNTPEPIPKGQESHSGIIKLDHSGAQTQNIVVLTVFTQWREGEGE